MSSDIVKELPLFINWILKLKYFAYQIIMKKISDGSGPKNTGSGRARAFNVGLGPGPGLGPSLEAGLRAGLGPFIN